jgi:hypothetical protein
MHENRCPKCGSSDIVLRTVNDRLRAADLRGNVFELPLQLPIWSCLACRLCWQGQEAEAVKEAAYQQALSNRSCASRPATQVARTARSSPSIISTASVSESDSQNCIR